MPKLYLHCALCSRKQADGLLSGAAWKRHPLPDGAEARVCPSCVRSDPEWQYRLSPAGEESVAGD